MISKSIGSRSGQDRMGTLRKTDSLLHTKKTVALLDDAAVNIKKVGF